MHHTALSCGMSFWPHHPRLRGAQKCASSGAPPQCGVRAPSCPAVRAFQAPLKVYLKKTQSSAHPSPLLPPLKSRAGAGYLLGVHRACGAQPSKATIPACLCMLCTLCCPAESLGLEWKQAPVRMCPSLHWQNIKEASEYPAMDPLRVPIPVFFANPQELACASACICCHAPSRKCASAQRALSEHRCCRPQLDQHPCCCCCCCPTTLRRPTPHRPNPSAAAVPRCRRFPCCPHPTAAASTPRCCCC